MFMFRALLCPKQLFSIYRGFNPLHKRFKSPFSRYHIKQMSILWVLTLWGLLPASSHSQFLTSPARPVISPIVEAESSNCQTVFRNPALISYSSNTLVCSSIQASQLYGIPGLNLFETGLELPKHGIAFGLRTLQWASFHRLQWISGYAITMGELHLGMALNLLKDQFPTPYYGLQKGQLTLGSFYELRDDFSIAVLSENIVSRRIGKQRVTQTYASSQERRISIAGRWIISRAFFVSGGVRLDPFAKAQTELSFKWVPVNQVDLQAGHRSEPRLMYVNIGLRSKKTGIGFSSYWHADLGHTLSVYISRTRKNSDRQGMNHE